MAFDMGATSGRAMLGTLKEDKLQMRELARFRNHIIEIGEHCYWDLMALYREIIGCLKRVSAEGIEIESIGIDTWGVDYVLLKGDEEVLPVYAYRDSRTEAVIPEAQQTLPEIEFESRSPMTHVELEGITDSGSAVEEVVEAVENAGEDAADDAE